LKIFIQQKKSGSEDNLTNITKYSVNNTYNKYVQYEQ